MEKRVSVIIPVYNTEKYLKRCLDSVLKQTYPHLEVIIIDDGSTDNSKQIIANYNDERINYIYQENHGQAAARNHGLDKATGDYIIMVDSDDFISENLVTICLKAAEKNHSDLVIFTSYNINEDGKKQYIRRNSGYKLTDAGSVPWNKFYQRALWENRRFPEGYWYEDLGVIPVIVERAQNPIKLEDALYYYQVDREDSQSNLIDNYKFLDVVPMLQNVENLLQQENLLTANKQDVEYLYMEHLVYRTILRKIIFIEDKQKRKQMLAQIRNIIKMKFPHWRANGYRAGQGLTATLKKLAVSCYLAGFIQLGDFIWKVPFEKRRQKTGF